MMIKSDLNKEVTMGFFRHFIINLVSLFFGIYSRLLTRFAAATLGHALKHASDNRMLINQEVNNFSLAKRNFAIGWLLLGLGGIGFSFQANSPQALLFLLVFLAIAFLFSERRSTEKESQLRQQAKDNKLTSFDRKSYEEVIASPEFSQAVRQTGIFMMYILWNALLVYLGVYGNRLFILFVLALFFLMWGRLYYDCGPIFFRLLQKEYHASCREDEK